MHPNHDLATQRASERALSYTVEAYGRQGWLDKPDAHRHAICNSLIASYNASRYLYKSDCIGFAKEFTDAHARGMGANPDYALDQPMDYHNYAGGRTYFYGKAVNRGSISWWGYNSRWVQVPDDATTKSDIKTLADAAFRYTATSQLSSLGARLVFVQD